MSVMIARRLARLVFALLCLGLLPAPIVEAQTTRTVCAVGCNHTTVDAALAVAVAGDTITLKAGETFAKFTLPNKGNLATPITIRSDTADANLPAAGHRIGPSYVAFLPTVQSTVANEPSIQTAVGAQDYVIRGVQILSNPSGMGVGIELGTNTTAQQFEADQPGDIVVDRVIVRGDPVHGQKIGIDLNGRNLQVLNSHIDGIAGVGQDAIAVRCINGTGPLTVLNNYLEGAGQNFLCGGDDPQIRTFAEVAGGATTTQATLQNFRTGHTIATLKVGQLIAVLATGGANRHHTYVRACGTSTPGAACSSNTLTYDEIPSAPATGVGSDIRWGAIPSVTFRRNHVAKPTAWADPILGKVGTVQLTPSTSSGSLAGGTYCYRVVARNPNGYQGNAIHSSASTEQCVSLSATGQIALSWPAVTNATEYRIFGRAQGAPTGYFSTANTTFTDTGAALTAGSIPSASKWTVKNLFEIKFCVNCQVDSNIFETSYTGADTGYGIWLKSNNSGGNAEFAQTKDLVFEKNIIRNVPGCFSILGRINSAGADRSAFIENLTIRDVLCYNSNSAFLQGKSTVYAIKVQAPTRNLRIEHGTFIHHMRGFMYLDGAATGDTNTNLVIADNLTRRETYGLFGSNSCTQGTSCLETHTNGYTYGGNVMAGGSASAYPVNNNLFPSVAEFESQHFVNYGAGVNGDYSLVSGSSWRNSGTDSTDRGARMSVVVPATTGVIEGLPEGGSGPTPLSITTVGLTGGTQNVAYSATLTATGGTTPYTWSLASGTLPAGLSLSTAGVISGTPTTIQSSSFTVQVQDAAVPAATDTQALTLTISGATSSLSVVTTSLSDAVLGTPYTAALVASGGVLPHTWDVSAGTLPNGFQLASNGTLTGVPVATGTTNVTVRVTDSGGVTATQALSLLVAVETMPCSRNRATAQIESVIFRRPTFPTNCVLTGDLLVHTGTTPPEIYVAAKPSPSAAWSRIQLAESNFPQLGTPIPGDIIVADETGAWVRFPSGPTGTVLCSTGDGLTYCAQETTSFPAITTTIRADGSDFSATASTIQGTGRQELGGSTGYNRVQLDLANASQMRIVAQQTATATTAIMRVEYSTDRGANWVATSITVTLGATAHRQIVGAWTAIPAGMQGDVTIRLVLTNGDGVESPDIANAAVSYR